MRLSVTASLLLALGLILPENVSLLGLPEDLEASGYDLDGSGSGDDPEGDSKEGTNNNPGPAVVSNPNGNINADKSSSGLNSGSSNRFDGLVVVSNTKSELENKEVTAAATAGGITGAVIGVLLSAILIYKWRKKHKEECILNQKKASSEDYLKTNRDVTLI